MSLSSIAQDTINKLKPKMYSVETVDGTTILGALVSEDATKIILNTKSLGAVTIMKNKIKKMEEISEGSFVNGTYWFENPNATRYFFGPSAFCLKKGEGYYQNMYLFGQSFNIGITDHISIGAGTEIASVIFARTAPLLFFITPKIGFDLLPNLKLGAGALYTHVFSGQSERINLGVVYGLVTTGTLNNNFTIGVGWGYRNYKTYYSTPSYQPTYNSGFSDMPIITFNGMVRPAKRFALITENWIFPVQTTQYNWYSNSTETISTYQYIISYGMRFIGERISVDFGFFNNKDIVSASVIGIPYIDFVVKFGGNK